MSILNYFINRKKSAISLKSPLAANQTLWLDTEEAKRDIQAGTLPLNKELTNNLVELRNSGVTIIKGGSSKDLCDEVKSEYLSWCRKNAANDKAFSPDKNGFNNRLVNFHLASPNAFKLFAENKKALAVMDSAFGGKKSSAYTSLFFQAGTQQPIHRDTPVFRTEPERWYFGFWTALEDVTPENGPLMVIRGGHKIETTPPWEIAEKVYPRLADEKEQDVASKLWPLFQDKMHEVCIAQGLTVETITMNKGDSVIWHPELPHGGSPVINPSLSRYSMVYHIVPEGVPVYQAKAFFAKNPHLEMNASWNYREQFGRHFADFGSPTFM